MVKPLFNRWIFVFFARLLNNSFLLFLCCIFQMFRKSSPGYDTPASQSSRGSNHGESIFTGYDTPASHIPGVAYTGESISPGGMIPKRVHFPGECDPGEPLMTPRSQCPFFNHVDSYSTNKKPTCSIFYSLGCHILGTLSSNNLVKS